MVENMHKFIYFFMIVSFVPLAHAREIRLRWGDSVEIKNLDQARKTAEAEKKLITVIIGLPNYDSETRGAQQVVDVIEDTIKSLKGSSVIVKGTFEELRALKQGDVFNIALAEGIREAGNGLPMIIVLNPAEKKLVKVIAPIDVQRDGSRVFREIKKIARDLKKE